MKEYFCVDGKDIKIFEVYDENDFYVNWDLCLYVFIFLFFLGSYEGIKYNDIIYDCFKGVNIVDSYNKFVLFNGYCLKKGCDLFIINNLGFIFIYIFIMCYVEVLLSYLEVVNEL